MNFNILVIVMYFVGRVLLSLLINDSILCVAIVKRVSLIAVNALCKSVLLLLLLLSYHRQLIRNDDGQLKAQNRGTTTNRNNYMHQILSGTITVSVDLQSTHLSTFMRQIQGAREKKKKREEKEGTGSHSQL